MPETSGRPRHLPEISDEHWDAFNSLRKDHEATWVDVFKRMFNYQDWVGHLFELPEESTDSAKLNAVTVTTLLPAWLENIRNNFLDVVDISDMSTIKDTTDGAGLVIGAGPSLLNNNHLGMLRESSFYKDHKGVIISTAHSLIWCLEAGVVPDYITMVDADEKMVRFVDHPLVKEHSAQITGLFSTNTHPEVFNHWNGEKLFFLPAIPHITVPNVQSVLSMLFPGTLVFDCMANCGSFSWNVARYTGCDQIAVIGLDFAFEPDFPIKDTPYYDAYKPSYDTEQDMLEKCYRFHTHSFFGNNCYTDHIHDSFQKTFVEVCKIYKERMGVTTVNCTGGGVIDDPEIENAWFKDWLAGWE